MKATDGAKGYCPRCKGPVTRDLKGRRFVRHRFRLSNGDKCTWGLGQKG